MVLIAMTLVVDVPSVRSYGIDSSMLLHLLDVTKICLRDENS